MAMNCEDRQIRSILIIGGTAIGAGFLIFAVIIALMVAYNFNFLQWME